MKKGHIKRDKCQGCQKEKCLGRVFNISQFRFGIRPNLESYNVWMDCQK